MGSTNSPDSETESRRLREKGDNRSSYGVLDRISLSMGFNKLGLEERSRRLMAVLVVVITAPASLGFSLYHLTHGVYTSGLAILPLAISSSILPFQLRHVGNATNVFRGNLIVAGLMMLYVFSVAAPHGHEALWLYVFPLACFFLLGKKEGIMFSLLLLLLALLLFILFDPLLGVLHYDSAFVVRFSMVYLILCGCSYSYESVRSMFRKGMDQKHHELIKEKEKLVRSKKAAEAANAAKTEFLANMSHELRTPLNHIIGFTQLLADERFGKTNEQQKEYLHYVLQSGNHLLALISDILDLTNLEAGKLRLETSEVNFRTLLENSLFHFRDEAVKGGIQLTQELIELPEVIRMDEKKVVQVMQNLLSNAIKFTPQDGSVHITAFQSSKEDGSVGGVDVLPSIGKSHRQNVDGDFIEVSVSDTGIGIDPKSLDRIFDPFEQVENSASRKYKGSGLGLPLTRSLVELHGGKIWAESEGEGKGSTFRFILPFSNGLNKKHDSQEDLIVQSDVRKGSANQETGGER